MANRDESGASTTRAPGRHHRRRPTDLLGSPCAVAGNGDPRRARGGPDVLVGAPSAAPAQPRRGDADRRVQWRGLPGDGRRCPPERFGVRAHEGRDPAAQLRVFGPAIDDATLDVAPSLARRRRRWAAPGNSSPMSTGSSSRSVPSPTIAWAGPSRCRGCSRDGDRDADRVDEVAVPETLATRHAPRHRRPPRRLRILAGAGRRTHEQRRPAADPRRTEVRLRVVGITRIPSDLSIEGDAGGLLLATPAFLDRYGDEIGTFAPVVLFVRLSDADDAPRVVEFLRRQAGSESVASGEFQVQPSSEFEGGVEQSIDVLTTGLIVFAVVAGFAGLVVAAIVLRRVADGFGRDVPLLQSLGLSRRMRVVTVGLAALPVALVGAALAVVGAFALVTADAPGHRAPCRTSPRSRFRRRRADGRLRRDRRGHHLGLGVWVAHRVVALSAAEPTNRRRTVRARTASDGVGAAAIGDGRDRDDARARRERTQRIRAHRRRRCGRRRARCRRGRGVRDEPRRAAGRRPCVRHQLGCRSRHRRAGLATGRGAVLRADRPRSSTIPRLPASPRCAREPPR